MRTAIFTDLDGTLLDRDTYSWAAAAAALDRVRQREIPLIIATSKTLAETVVVRSQILNDHPFIVENGAAIAVPPRYFGFEAPQRLESWNGFELKRFSESRDLILSLLGELRRDHGYRFEGFGDWTPQELAERSGLPVEDAERALERCGSEPLVWLDTDENLGRFRQRLARNGLRLVQGGRFLHVMGDFDKAKAFAWLKSMLKPETTVALGDSPNDEAMLDQADIAVVVRSPHSDSIRLTQPQRIIKTKNTGPAGWQEALEALLPELP